ncbi:MAG: Hpt domain-containing protein [Candidatus Krumholzibacteriota bacterium]|nr:Hpt domain-containing protein [Candidatus Krumholzibacteriota bacterium]
MLNNEDIGFSPDFLLDQIDNDKELFDTLINIFVEDAGDHIRLIRESIEKNDIEKTQRESHTLKGASGTIGAALISQLAAEIEKRSKDSDLSGTGELLIRIERAFQDLLELLGKTQDSSGVEPSGLTG